MITVDELRELETGGETGCSRRGLRALTRVLNESGSDKATRVDVLRLICAYAREDHVEPLEFLRHREKYLGERQRLYDMEIYRERGTSTAMRSKLRDVQTLRDALADMAERADFEYLIRKHERL